MPVTWRKVENEKGFPYYVNENNEMKQWDHPKFAEIKQSLDDCNYIKYATYRVASKFRVLQQALYTEDISLTSISGVFEKHRLRATESSLCLEHCDVEAVLTDIYFASNKQNHTNIDIDFATELMVNFLYNIFDKDRRGNIQVSSAKLVLAILSNSKLSEVYRFIFNLCADHNNCVTRLRLQTILVKFAEITTFLHEDVSFGQHLVNEAVDECFSNSPGLVGINENTFVSWLETSPLLISWIPALHKLRSSESILHTTKCSVCKSNPIMGLRYRCNKCSRYIQCQRCFLTGRISHSHKLSHSMREYGAEGITKDNPLSFLKKLCKFLKCSRKVEESYCTNEAEHKSFEFEKSCIITTGVNKDETFKSEDVPEPYSQLQRIIRHLEVQNSELWHILTLGNKNDKQMKKYLESHRQQVDEQISKLKSLKDTLQLLQTESSNRVNKPNVESTPMVPNGRNQMRNTDLDLFSPICLDNTRHKDFSADIKTFETTRDTSLAPYSLRDISTWLGGCPNGNSQEYLDKEASLVEKKVSEKYAPVREMHTDLDEALAKLQQILANNFVLDESLGSFDNGQLKYAVNEVEGMLTSLIDTVENSRAASTQPAADTNELINQLT